MYYQIIRYFSGLTESFIKILLLLYDGNTIIEDTKTFSSTSSSEAQLGETFDLENTSIAIISCKDRRSLRHCF